MKNSILTFTFGICSVVLLLSIVSCTSMKTLDNRANVFVDHWKGKSLEEFVKSNPDIDPFQVVDLGMGKKRYVFRYQEPLTANEMAYSMITSDHQSRLIRFIYLFVNKRGIIYDASWQRKLVR